MTRRISSAPCPASTNSESGLRPRLIVGHTGNVQAPSASATGQARAILSAALRLAMRDTDASVPDVAFWCNVDPRTVRRWLSDDPTAPSVDARAVMNSKRLRGPFARALVSLLHSEGNHT